MSAGKQQEDRGVDKLGKLSMQWVKYCIFT